MHGTRGARTLSLTPARRPLRRAAGRLPKRKAIATANSYRWHSSNRSSGGSRVQSTRIKAIREVATKKGVDLFINARTDVFFAEGDPADFMKSALDRAKAYAE